MSIGQFLASPSTKILVEFTKNKLVKLTGRVEIRVQKSAKRHEIIELLVNYFQLQLECENVSASDNDSISGAENISITILKAKL